MHPADRRPRYVPNRSALISAAVGLFVLGCAMWWFGARDAPPLGPSASFSWVAFAAAGWLTLRWHSAPRR
ncbi:hypothetical protein [Cellulomonas sp. NS3]|uniref:hypothetical protein n=1 Tax=Cellulomonas sp. NS3 TaxID=2973977 RepID=UPI0021615089|nr:hypothetical protein [Cellulomonas sp. NS3]